MGLAASISCEQERNNKCYICHESVDPIEHVQCIRCHVAIHRDCFSNEQGERTYCICPSCQEVGTMSVRSQNITSKLQKIVPESEK